MTELFDIKTLLLTTALINLVIAGLLTFYWRTQPTYPGFGFWAASHAVGCCAFTLYALRGVVPDVASIVIANTLTMLFSGLRLEGIRLFVDGTWRRMTLWLYPLLIAPLLYYFSQIVDDILIRTIIINLFLAVIVGQMLIILGRHGRLRGNTIYWAPFFFFAAFLLLLTLRLGNWLIAPELRGLFASSTANNTFFLVVLLHDIGIAVSYLMLNARRRSVELRQAHDELQRFTDRLHDMVRAETEKGLLQERLLAHNARLAAMGEMLGVIAHQWRQPLTTLAAIIQRLDILQRQGTLGERDMREGRLNAMEQIRHLSETIEEFRNFYLPDRLREPFAPVAALQAALTLAQPQLTANTIRLETELEAADAPLLVGFPNQFKQMILNLVTNAREAIIARRRADSTFVGGTVRITLNSNTDEWRLTVSDNGCGIPAEIGDKIYEAFYTTRQDEGGSGIGLYMSHAIVCDGFSGAIDYTSKVGHTTFTIRLPLHLERESSAA